MYWYWWIWWAAIVVLLIWLISAWSYRGLGPPYPSYYGRRRHREPANVNPGVAPTTRAHPGWGVAADFFWLAALGALIWAVVWWFH